MASEGRQQAEKFGRKGEFWAKFYLRMCGFRIVAERYKARNGELDLIACRGKTLIFVEVKTRAHPKMLAQAFEAVRQDRIINAAQFWLGQNPNFQNHTIRFDVIGLAPMRWPVHIVDAFQTN